MQLSLQTFSTLVQNMAASVQSAASQAFDVTVGSTVRAILEANASVALWMQWLILQVLQSTRAATSNGADLDTWMADFTLTRLPAVAATGTVTFSRYTATMPALIAPGVLVRTGDGAQTFSVVADTTNAAWNSQSAAYTLAAGISSITVPVAAQVSGSAGNVQAATVTLLATAVP
ncbi:MAG: baseplate J/gp47 family protein, partial [Chloroflexi bacterium]|nr:baseplate J/gp47 family protein [Chloroflexota bacterium]